MSLQFFTELWAKYCWVFHILESSHNKRFGSSECRWLTNSLWLGVLSTIHASGHWWILENRPLKPNTYSRCGWSTEMWIVIDDSNRMWWNNDFQFIALTDFFNWNVISNGKGMLLPDVINAGLCSMVPLYDSMGELICSNQVEFKAIYSPSASNWSILSE